MPWKSYNTAEIREEYLFKFLPLTHLKAFLKNGEIWFSRADQFGDKMECVRISDLVGANINYSQIESRKRKFMISCWHLANKESLAFWDTYSDNNDLRKVVAMRFKRDVLVRKFQDYFHRNNKFYIYTNWVHGRVQYRNMINKDEHSLLKVKMRYPAFRKEKAFSYENEYRFCIQQQIEMFENGFGYYIGDPRLLSFDILINPLIKKEEYLRVHAEIKALGFENKIQESILMKWLRPDKW